MPLNNDQHQFCHYQIDFVGGHDPWCQTLSEVFH